MSVNDNYQVDSTVGNGATVTFTGNWTPIAASYMQVALQEVATGIIATPLSQGAGAGEYTLSFTDAGYSVTLGTAPSSSYNVLRYRVVAQDQTTPYTTAKGFQGAVTEDSFDKLTAITQDLRDDVNRSIRFQTGDDLMAELPPVISGDAGKVLAINAAEDGIELLTPNSDTYLSVTAFISTLLDDDTAADARTTLGAASTGANTFTGTQTMSGAAINTAAEVDIASATTTDIGAAASNNVRITGTTTITGLGTAAAGITRNIRFAGALTFTHNGTSLILPSGANITTAANDTCEALSLGSGNWIITHYKKQDGTAISAGQANLTPITNSLTGDVTLTTQNTYYTGPTVAQGSTGTWFASGTVTVAVPSSGQQVHAKLWDGTTVIASASLYHPSDTFFTAISLSGYLASPAGNIRISVTNAAGNGGSIKFNSSGNSKDSTLTAFRIV